MKRLLSWFERRRFTDNTGKLAVPQVLQSQFSPLNDLEQLLVDAGYEPDVRPAFEQKFLEHKVLIAIRDDGYPDGPLSTNDTADLGVYTLTADDGGNYPVGFTAEDRGYDCFGPETVMAKLSGRQLLEMVSEAGVWINPSSAFGVLWSSNEIRRILLNNPVSPDSAMPI